MRLPHHRAQRRLSQNFLVDGNLARKLVDALETVEGDAVLEVGPGTGALTQILVARGVKLVAVERDRKLVELLRQRFAAGGHFLEADFLDVDPWKLELPEEGSRFISNLPYGITSPVLFHVITSRFPFERLVVTVQKEVAQRLCASPATKDYGRLTVMVSLYGTVRKLFHLPPSAFRPRPSVTSTAVLIEPNPERWPDPISFGRLEAVVRAAFAERRKTIANSLASSLGVSREAARTALLACGIEPGIRAERLEPAAFVALSKVMPSDSC